MRIRSLRISLLLLLVLAASAALAGPARAQHCWPASLALLVRNESGAVIHPDDLDSLAYSPVDPDSADMAFSIQRLNAYWKNAASPGTPALRWAGQGDCRVYLDEVTLVRGGRVMRLRMDLRLDTEARPGPTEFLIEAPPFAPGTWKLEHPLPRGEIGGPARVGAERWRRMEDGGE